MTDNQWRTYSPDNPPGDDDWPTEYRLILLRLNNTISESGAVCIGYVKQGSQGPYFVHIGVEGEVTHYKDSLGDDFSVPGWALINTPPEPDLPPCRNCGELPEVFCPTQPLRNGMDSEWVACKKCSIEFRALLPPEAKAKWREVMGPGVDTVIKQLAIERGRKIIELREELDEQGKKDASAERVMDAAQRLADSVLGWAGKVERVVDAYHDHRVKFPKEGE